MMNAGNLKGKTRQTSDWRRRMIAFVSALTLLISSCGLTAFAESDEDIYSDPVTAPIPAANTSPEPEEGGAEVTPAPEGQPEEGTEPQELTGETTGEGTETEGEPEVSEEPEDLTVYEPGTLTAEADGIGITVDYTAEARVPEGTVLTLTRAAGGDLYSALKSASKVLKTEENATWKRELGEDAVFYAITLTNPEGNEVHPETGVTLTCTNLEIPADATGFVTGDNAENLDWKDTLTVGFLPDAIGYAYLKQVQIGTVTLTHEDRDYMVTAAYGPNAGFPADTELKVREILPGTPEYALYSGMTDEALNEDWAEITLERYFDIAFVANGEELEPKADVDVQIVFRDKIEQNEETEVAAVHIENNEANVIEAETDSTKSARHDNEAIDTVTFTSDSFSVYGVVQKKKIITKVLAADGNTYEIEISYTQEAEIPEESQVKVEEIPEGSDLWEAYRKQTAAALNADDVRLPGLYDISIIDAEGAKIEPKAPVSVSIKLANAEADNEDLHVVHFTEEIPQELVEAEAKSEEQTEVQPIAEEDKIESENIKANVEGDTVTFDTQGFSVYAFAYKIVTYYKTASGETYKITLNYDENSGIPEGAELHVEELQQDTERYEEYLAKTAEALNKDASLITNVHFFDIEIIKDGEKIEPTKPVEVTINYVDPLEITDESTLQVVHFGDNGTEIISEYTISDDNTKIVYYQDSFSVTATVISGTPQSGKKYVVIVKYDNKYYSLLNNGELEPADGFYDYSSNSIKAEVAYPLMWTYQPVHILAARPGNPDPAAWNWSPYNLAIPTTASGFWGNNLPSGYYYRLVNVNEAKGWSEESETYKNLAWWSAIIYEDHRIHGYGDSSGRYIGVKNENGKLSICGLQDRANAAEVYLATVMVPDANSNTHDDHTVNHIDISIEGYSQIKIPLPYGDYTDQNGNKIYTATKGNNTITVNQAIGINTNDMKTATIKAYNKNTGAELSNAFYITGYSQNHETGANKAQVRIEGSFKVSNLGRTNNADNQWDINSRRRGNPITYTVSVVKTVTVDVKYNNQDLYRNGKKVSYQVPITLSASFDYWQNTNKCPPLHIDYDENKDFVNDWKNGKIVGSGNEMSGMDFELGAKATVSIPSIGITKIIQTTDGTYIQTPVSHNVDVDVFHKTRNEEDVNNVNYLKEKGLDSPVTEEQLAALTEGYSKIHRRTVTAGTNGIGTIYDFDVTKGMLYIQEVPESVDQEIVDINGKRYEYVETRMETEYLWDSAKRHHADGSTSVPSVLGLYRDNQGQTQENSVIDYYIYNIYKPVTEITVSKEWSDGEENHTTDSVTLMLYRFTQQGSVPPSPEDYGILNLSHVVSADGTVTKPSGFVFTAKDSNNISHTLSEGDNSLPYGEYEIIVSGGTDTERTGYEYKGTTPSPSRVTVGAEPINVTVTSTYEKEQATGNITTLHVHVDGRGYPNYAAAFYSLHTGHYYYQDWNFSINEKNPEGETINVPVKNSEGVAYEYEFYVQPSNFGQSNKVNVTSDRTGVTSEDVGYAMRVSFSNIPGDLHIYVSGKNNTSNRLTIQKALRFRASEPAVSDVGAGSTTPAGEFVKNITLMDGHWSETVDDLDIYDSEGNLYYYAIKEITTTEGYIVTCSDPVAANGNDLTLTAINTKGEEKGKLTVKKTWDGVTDETDLEALQRGLSITITGRDIGGAGIDTLSLDWDGVKDNGKTIENLPLSALYSITETNSATETLNKYTLRATSVQEFTNERASVEGTICTLKNEYDRKTGVDYDDVTINIHKIGHKLDSTDTDLESVEFALTGKDAEGKDFTLTGITDENGKASITLDGAKLGAHGGAADNTTIKTFSLVETVVPAGYRSDSPWIVTIQANGAESEDKEGTLTTTYHWQLISIQAKEKDALTTTDIETVAYYTVINTQIPTIDITASKDWANATMFQPDAIQFTLYQDGEIYTEGGIENPVTVIKGDTWPEVSWQYLPKYVDETVEDEIKVEHVYTVEETKVFFGEIPYGDVILESDMVNPDMYAAEANNTVDSETGNITTVIKNSPVTVNVPVEKTWAEFDADSVYDWNATFKLKWAPLYTNEASPSTPYADYPDSENPVEITINKSQMSKAANRTETAAEYLSRCFTDLPKYGIDDTGLYRILYSVEEVSYQVTENGVIKYSYDSTNGYLPSDESYSANVTEIAGLTGSADSDYEIKVLNNKSINYLPLIVKKEWHDIKDPNNYPEIRFTLYQAPIGLVHEYWPVEGDFERALKDQAVPYGNYVDIPLNSQNNWTWVCPEELPATNGNGTVSYAYYVVEKTGEWNNNREALLYQNSAAVDPIDASTQSYGRVMIWDYYNNKNSNHAYRNDQQQPQGSDAAILGNNGTLTIVNRATKYIQFDVKKKWLEVYDGALHTTTSYPHRLKNTFVKIVLMRKTVPAEGDINDTLVDWEDYGVPFYIGYDGSGTAKHVDPNNYGLVNTSSWQWQIIDNNQENGLPAYGYLPQTDGTYKKVKYYYITREMGVYKNPQEAPLDIDSDYYWYMALLPQAWGDNDRPEVFPKAVAQDQDRLLNQMASDLLVEKVWENDESMPSDVSEVYVKIKFTIGNASQVYDFTEDIVKRIQVLSNYGFVPISEAGKLKNVSGIGYVLSLTRNTSQILIKGVPLGDTSGWYKYWIEEVGYKDSDGNVYNSAAQFFPEYDQSNTDTGVYKNVWKADPTSEKLTLSTKGRNKLRVKNHPIKDIDVLKQWVDENGTVLSGPWNKPGTNEAVTTSIRFKIKRNNTDYLTFNGSETLEIGTDGQRAVVKASTNGGIAYTVETIEDSTDQADIGNWKTIVHGLQKNDLSGNPYTYTIEELVDQDGKPLDNNGDGIDYCQTSITADGEHFTIVNEKMVNTLAIRKTFSGNAAGELTEDQKKNIEFHVTNGATYNKTFYYGIDRAEDSAKWNGNTLYIKNVEAGEYTVTEQHHSPAEVFGANTTGASYNHSWTYTVASTTTPGTAEDAGVTATVADNNVTLVIIDNKYEKAQLEITKDVLITYTNETTSDELPEHETITFTITPADGLLDNNGQTKNAYTYPTDFTEGKLILTQANGVLPNTEYTVTETDVDLDGYTRTTTITVNDGDPEEFTQEDDNLSGKGKTEVDDYKATFAFENNYVEIPYGSLEINKVLATGSSATASDVFTFDIELKDLTGTAFVGEVKKQIADGDDVTTTPIEISEENGGKFSITIQGAGSVTIVDIPKDTRYTVSEATLPGWQLTNTVYSNEGELKAITAGETDSVTFTNAQTVDIDVNKDWIPEAPKDVTITLGLFKKSNLETAISTIRLNGKPDVEQNPTEGQETIESAENDSEAYEDVAWHAIWLNLPKCDEDGIEIEYVVKETSELTGYTVSYADGKYEYAKDGETITNKLNEINLNIVKVDSKDEDKKLNNAVFALYKEGADKQFHLVTDESIGEVNKEGQFTVNETVKLTNITDGVYQILEVSPPAGYLMLATPIEFTVDGGDITEVTPEDETVTYVKDETENADAVGTMTIKNTAGAELPATGGSGTLIYTITGIFLIMLAGTLLVVRKRKANR